MADAQGAPVPWGGEGAGFWGRLWDVINGGGRQGTAYQPREGYTGRNDLGGWGQFLGGTFFGWPGAIGGRKVGNALEGPNPGGRYVNGEGSAPAPTNPWDALPWADPSVYDGVSVGQNDAGWFGGDYYKWLGSAGIGASGSPLGGRTVEVGNYGGAGDSFTYMFPNFGGDDINMVNPEFRRTLMTGGNPDGIIGNTNVSFDSPEAYLQGLYGRNPDAFQFVTNTPPGLQFGGFDFTQMPQFGGGGVDFSQFMLPMNGGGGGGGGRGGDAGQNTSRAAGNQFLTDAYTNLPNFSIDPQIQGQINSLIGQGTAGYDQFSGQLLNNPFVAGMFGMLGGGGSGGGFGGGGGGGGGSYTPNVGYRDIPPHMVELLESMRMANIGRLNLQTQDLQDSAIADLYAGGINRSDLALDQIGLLSYGQGQLLNDINAQIDAGRLGLIENDLDSQTAIAQSQIAAAAQRAAASSSAAASMFGSRAGLLGSMFGDYSSALANGFNTNMMGLTDFASTLGNIGVDQMNTNAGIFSDFGDYATRANESADRLAGDRAAANAARYGARLGYNSDIMNYGLRNQEMQNDWLFNFLNFGENQRQFDADLGLRRDIFEQGIPSDGDKWLSLLGMLGGAAGNYWGNRQGGG